MAKEMIAMLLAGGQGSRLYALTQNLAKPAVPFGGKYRIIDFPLSNCVNSGIDTVGILTQYQPLVLNEYIGNGQPWDLDRLHGGVHVLPPYQQASGSDWYKGTANAIYQNISFIDRYDPEYVIILSGDQICKQAYSDFLKFHKEKGAEFSVAVMEVPWEEASRFGLMVTDDNDKITEFQEKPKEPKSNLASMGIYIFNWDILRKYLEEDEADPNSENDFGNNIIPNLLRDGRDMYAYRFSGYWKDVGTIPSLWEANYERDILSPHLVTLDVQGYKYDGYCARITDMRSYFAENMKLLEDENLDALFENGKIYTKIRDDNPTRYINGAVAKNVMAADGCVIEGDVENCILFRGVRIAKGAKVRNCVLMQDTVVEEGAKLEYVITDKNVVITKGQEVKGTDTFQVFVEKGKTV